MYTNFFFDLKRFYQTVDVSNLNDNSFKFVNNINFNQVSFRFHHDKQLLNNISFKIEKNSIIGIFGESGSGKSTILNTISNLVEHKKGFITFDNTLNNWIVHDGTLYSHYIIVTEELNNNNLTNHLNMIILFLIHSAFLSEQKFLWKFKTLTLMGQHYFKVLISQKCLQ